MVHAAPLPKNEAERLAALRGLYLLGTPSDPAFDQMTKIASLVFESPIVLISLVDEGRQWFKSKIGMEARETPRSQAFCAYALHSSDPTIVLDTSLDKRFSFNPLVIGEPYLRFYAGAPLITSDGICLGTFCILGTQPRQEFTDQQANQLVQFARLAMMRIETLRSIGYVDPLTQLPNRTRFQEDIELWINDWPKDGRKLFAVAIDICNASYFRQMLATFGSDYADGFLLTATGRIVYAISPAPVYRVDSTVYACVLEAKNDENLLAQLYAMQTQFSEMIEHQGIPHAPQVVIGAVRIALDNSTADITRTLRSALSYARTNRLATMLYQPKLDLAQQRAFHVLAAIPAALISKTQLCLQYQPRVDLRNGRCIGVEALIRWNHPELGIISPGEFIPLAEKTALIRKITIWVLKTVLLQAEKWQAAGYFFMVSFNVSAIDLDNGEFSEHLTQALSRHCVDANFLEIEFTESATAGDPIAVYEQLKRIRMLGLQIAIDDFGSGYSNLAYLKQIPATALKIDQSFFRAITHSPSDISIIRSIISLGHQFEYRVVAEGIETKEVFELIKSWNCDEGQGYWIAKPMPPENLLLWIASRDT